MAKWADYLISEVSYDSKHRIKSALRHKDTGTDIEEPEIVTRVSILDDLRRGVSYCTMFSGVDTWTRGDRIRLHRVGARHSLRIDRNKVDFDNLGTILEMKPEKPAIGTEPKPPLGSGRAGGAKLAGRAAKPPAKTAEQARPPKSPPAKTEPPSPKSGPEPAKAGSAPKGQAGPPKEPEAAPSKGAGASEPAEAGSAPDSPAGKPARKRQTRKATTAAKKRRTSKAGAKTKQSQ